MAEPLGDREGAGEAVLPHLGPEVLRGAGQQGAGGKPGAKGPGIHPGADTVDPGKLPPVSYFGRSKSHEHIGPGHVGLGQIGHPALVDGEVGPGLRQPGAESLVQRIAHQHFFG
jgi:hypothetical protein